jgi:signal transduction histidine kinase
MATEGANLLARGTDLATHRAMYAAVATAHRTPYEVVLSPIFEHDGRRLLLVVFAAPNNGRDGVLVGLLDLSNFLARLTTHARPGVQLRLTQRETDWDREYALEPVIGSLEGPPQALETISIRVPYGQARWQFYWDVLPSFMGGPPSALGRGVMFGGSLVSLLLAALLGVFVSQNLRIRKKVQEQTAELAIARHAAERDSQTKSQFLANMSHDLRTPLNAIIGFSEIMQLETFGPIENSRYAEYVNDIHSSASLLLNLINDVLDMSKIEAGKVQLHDSEIDLKDLIDQTLRLVSGQGVVNGLRVDVDMSAGLPMLRADERALRQILLNLISNAVKFTPSGGNVTIRARSSDVGLAFDVCDTGIGIAADDIERILKPFGRAHDQEYQGTGLGLPIAKSLAELHGGNLAIRSEPGKGTRVTVTFPSARIVFRQSGLKPGTKRHSR